MPNLPGPHLGNNFCHAARVDGRRGRASVARTTEATSARVIFWVAVSCSSPPAGRGMRAGLLERGVQPPVPLLGRASKLLKFPSLRPWKPPIRHLTQGRWLISELNFFFLQGTPGTNGACEISGQVPLAGEGLGAFGAAGENNPFDQEKKQGFAPAEQGPHFHVRGP